MNWYALAVRPQAERAVEKALGESAYETFLPVLTSERRWSDRIKRIETALIPGYVFCRFDAAHRRPVLTTTGVREIVGFGRQPAAIDDDELLALRRVIECGLPVASCEYLERGQRVEVTGGPMLGLQGLLLEVKGQCRVVVSVELLRRSVSVELDRTRIRRLREMSMSAGGN